MTLKKPIKIILAVLIAIIVAVSALTLFVRSYLTDERIRTYVLSAAETSLGRKASLGEIRVSIFTGVSVRDFELKERDSDASFIKAESFEIRYRLLPLLSRSLVIDELRLSKASAILKKNPDGSFNFSDTGKKAGPDAEAGKAPAPDGLPVSLNIKKISLKDVSIYYSDPSGKVMKARMVLDGEFGVSSSSSGLISSSGKFRAKVAEALLKESKTPIRDLNTDIYYAADIDMSAKKVELRELKADLLGAAFSVKGYVSYAEPLGFAVDLVMPEIRLASLQTAASSFLPEGVMLDGGASLSLKAEKSGATRDRLNINGEVRMNNAAVSAKGYRPVFSGTVRFTPEQIRLEGIRLVAGKTGADITGSIRNYADTPEIQLQVKSGELNLDEITSAVRPGAQEAAPAPADKEPGKAPDKDIGPFSTKARASASLGVGKVIYKGVPIQDLKAELDLRESLLKVKSLTGKTLSGSFSISSEIDLSKKGLAYIINSSLDGVLLEEITAAFAPKAKDMLYGKLYGKMALSGSGTIPESIKQNLKGNGSFTVQGGRIKNAKISTGLLSFIGLQEMKEINMESAKGSFTISGGIINLTSLITSKDLVLDEKGTISMDQQLDLGVMVKASERLSPKLLSQSSVSQFLSEEKGWISIPLKISGRMSEPSYSVDTQQLGRKAAEQLKKKAGGSLFKAITGSGQKEKSGTEPSPDQQQKKPAQSPVDLLKGFLGK